VRRHPASVVSVLSAGEEPLDFVDFLVCNGLAPLQQQLIIQIQFNKKL